MPHRLSITKYAWLIASIVVAGCPALALPVLTFEQTQAGQVFAPGADIDINAAPEITLLAPQADSRPSTTPLRLKAQARDVDGLITRIAFFGIAPSGAEHSLGTLNGSGKGSGGHDGVYQLDISLPDLAAGRWRIYARATDDRGSNGFSQPVAVWLGEAAAEGTVASNPK